ncbi:probable serine/threonine-protein kinase ndrD isoform X2 [Dendroctonus ponderosae]|uniref:probable serine/threonine-protein kinase ndrD isoform X2 n=1 Tax=Dendroctonus ponderosae TaxID=77166 RepID=UPI002034EEE3|nr:probable serine/threonine-protein kinase ndrD isoform X2 [Dendroctonus ponderosae]
MQQQPDSGAPGGSPAATGATGTAAARSHVNGGRFDFDDGGTYCGGWEDGKAHGHGVCTGPKGQGAYSGSWHYGFEVSGVYTWPSGSCFEGQWQNGKRHGLGVETRGRWIYRGEWTQGFKGRYGVRQSNTSTAKYQGTWANGLQDGYGSETYADDGTYQGQWMRGMRHGYGVRTSAPFGKASKYRGQKALRGSLSSLRSSEPGATPLDAAEKRDRRVDDSRGGFVLQSKSTEPTSTSRRRSLGSGNIKKNIFKKGASTGELDRRTGSGSIRSNASSVSYISTDSAGSVMTNASMPSDSNASFVIDDEHMDPNITETYMGEWSNDKRSGYGISERSDGLKYEGEWYANKKYGYGVTTFSNGEKEEGKYKNNVLITSQKKKKLFLMRSAKFRERIDAAVNAAQRASKIALQKADIAISRTATARGKAEQADIAAAQAREDSEVADTVARQYAPDFKQPDLERIKRQMKYREPNRNLDISIDQKELNATNDLNQLTNQIPNQIPNQVNNELSNQISNKMNKPMGNQIPNQLHNQVPNSNYAQSNTYQQQSTYQQQNVYQQQTNSYQPQQNTFQPQSNTMQQQQQNQYSQQQNSYQQQSQKSFHTTNNNPNGNNSYNQTNNPASFVNEFGPQVANNNQQSAGKNSGVEFNAPINNPRNSLTGENVTNTNSIRRMSRRVSGDRPYLGNIGQQSSIDHFDHYKRPPSRDSSVDRYSRATGRLSNSLAGSRQPSVDRNSATRLETPDRTLRAPSTARGSTPVASGLNSGIKNGSVPTGQGTSPTIHNNSTPPFEDVILRKRGLGQDIVPSPNQPKRTESLFIPGQPNAQTAKVLATQTSLQRKKSLPDVQELPRATRQMPREEVSYLGSARREEVRRQIDERERLRANPLLYLVSPQVKDWFSRQQLVLVVLFINISLAIMFFKLLT